MNEKKKAGILLIGAIILLGILVGLSMLQIKEENKLINKIKNIMNSDERQIIYLTRPTCSYCILLEPITDDLKEEYDLEYNIINTDEISGSQLNKILKLFDRTIDTFGTPYLVITKDGKVIAEQTGFADEDVIFDFFKKNGIIDESEELLLNYISQDEIEKIFNENQNKTLLIGEIGNEKVISAKKKVKELVKQNDLEVNYVDISKIDENKQQELLNGEEIPLLLIIEDGKIKISESDINKYEEILK